MTTKTLSIELRIGESVSFSGPAAFRLEDKSGSRARLMVTAEDDVQIERPKKHHTGADQAKAGLGFKKELR